MRLFSFLVLLCGLINVSFAQSVNNYSTTTDAHQLVAGTNIYLIPPADFSKSNNFTGFQNPEDPTSMIMVVSMPGPFDQVSAGFTEEMLASRGMVLQSKQSVDVNGQEALYIELDQNAQGFTFAKSMLIYGDSTSTTIINGASVKDSTALVAEIRESVRSVVIDAATEADPRAELAFTVDETAGDLQFISVVGNGVLLNRDGKTPTESQDEATLVIDRSRNNNRVKDKKAFTLLRLFSLPGGYELASKKYPRKTKLAGMKGYELFANNPEDQQETIHLTMLFEEDGGYYIFLATYLKGAKRAKADIKKVMRTFRKR
jgi:hypothetical protein